ncbi:hypothetical protein WJX81_002742 [Elliptochloris bilobata]|uniref:Uncharacterized protein n=1 Tax=Elliptochloris bilobata TaxID=381761 RepID=A0AAW1RXH7_9CHLO
MEEDRGRSGNPSTAAQPSQDGAAEKMHVEQAPNKRSKALAAHKGAGVKVKKAKKVTSVLCEEFHKRRPKGTRRGSFKRLILGTDN